MSKQNERVFVPLDDESQIEKDMKYIFGDAFIRVNVEFSDTKISVYARETGFQINKRMDELGYKIRWVLPDTTTSVKLALKKVEENENNEA